MQDVLAATHDLDTPPPAADADGLHGERRPGRSGIESAPDATEVLDLLSREQAETPRSWRVGPDPEALAESLREIHAALVSLTERMPPQHGPNSIAAAVERGLGDLRDVLASPPFRARPEEDAGPLPAGASFAARSAPDSAPAGAATGTPHRRRAVALLPIAGVAALLSAGAIWFATGNTRVAMIALVVCNVLGCAAIVLRRP
jgi:hypothetical protein